MSFEGKSQQEPRNWQMDRILIILKKGKPPKGFICPCTGVKYHNIQTCLLVYAADSGERLQDHWSSGLCLYRPVFVGHVRKPRWFFHEVAHILSSSVCVGLKTAWDIVIVSFLKTQLLQYLYSLHAAYFKISTYRL